MIPTASQKDLKCFAPSSCVGSDMYEQCLDKLQQLKVDSKGRSDGSIGKVTTRQELKGSRCTSTAINL
jgi:hypothetical protein